MKIILTLVVLVAIAGGFLGFTRPGHHVLNTLGFAAADPDGGGCPGSPNC